jgi:hypothetical protein
MLCRRSDEPWRAQREVRALVAVDASAETPNRRIVAVAIVWDELMLVVKAIASRMRAFRAGQG